MASVTVSPAGDTLAVSDSERLVATVRDTAGQVLTNLTVAWKSSDTSLARVSSSGVVTTFASGSVTVTASVAGKSGVASLLLATCHPSITESVTGNSFNLPVASGLIPNPSPISDIGFYKTIPVILSGGALFGTDTSHFILGYDAAGSLPSDLAATPECLLGTGSTQHTYAKLRARGGLNMPGELVVTQETYAFPASPDNGYVLVRYVFSDTAAVALTNFYAGFLIDWDVNFDNNATDDVVRYDPVSGQGQVEESDTLTHQQRLAIIPIISSGTTALRGWLNGADPTHGGYFAFLSGGIDTTKTGPGDIREMTGTGPFEIGPGQRLVVYFAIVGGDTQTAWSANVTAAKAKAASLGF